jgi:cysteine-S-conjugate beta-lyase
LDAAIDYLRGNRDMVTRAIGRMPGLAMGTVQATYLAWIDTRGLKIDNPGKWFESAGVGLSDGIAFDGQGFVRLNFGCQRALLSHALDRMAAAIHKRHALPNNLG